MVTREPITGDHVQLLWERACSGLELGSCSLSVRNLADGDLAQLAQLAYSAFAGTVDSVPLEIWARKLSSIASDRYGPFLSTASFVAEVPSGQLAGMVLATDFPLYNAPVIALIAVAPGSQQKGLGTYLLSRCIRTLALEGFPICRAKISPGNDASQQLFRKLGFELCCN
ncbi:N-acetyltransferase family protein [Cupriavidus sp. CP313]